MIRPISGLEKLAGKHHNMAHFVRGSTLLSYFFIIHLIQWGCNRSKHIDMLMSVWKGTLGKRKLGG